MDLRSFLNFLEDKVCSPRLTTKTVPNLSEHRMKLATWSAVRTRRGWTIRCTPFNINTNNLMIVDFPCPVGWTTSNFFSELPNNNHRIPSNCMGLSLSILQTWRATLAAYSSNDAPPGMGLAD